jgi:hypothetical protein
MSERADAINAAIAELEVKKALIENALASLRNLLASGVFGTPTEGIMPVPMGSPASNSPVAGEIPDGAFHGKSMPAAIKLYLEIMNSKKTAREISDGLRRGGLESTSKFFDKIVYATLDRLRKSGDVMKIGTAWGLPSWYPALVRAGVGDTNKPAKRRPGRPRKTDAENSGRPKLLKGTRRKMKSEPSPIDNIDWFLSSSPESYTSEQIRSETKMSNLRVTEMLLGKLVKRGTVEKTEDGKYRTIKAS